MRIVLIYPPPWKISRPGEAPYPPGEGAPVGSDPARPLDGDFLQAPYGMLSIAAQVRAAGHDIAALNLANACWTKVVQCIGNRQADIFGLSCVTANRRGVAMTARLIRETYPDAHIIVGGPHVTALPEAMLAHYDAIDTVALGEGEAVFGDLIQRLGEGRPAAGIPGTAWRENGACTVGPRRPPIPDLDALTPPQAYYPTRTVMTSRGCPGRCTFCGSGLMWGRRLRCHSVDYVMDVLARTVNHHRLPIVTIKDDTFTADRERVMAVCEEVCRRGLRFVWSCETRADCLDAEMLMAMRRAGCSRMSIGVESASREILKRIRKDVDPDTVMAATQMAKNVGIQVRYYMMAGNRGETFETFSQSLDFIRRARPHQYLFTQLHLYPGTPEYAVFRRHGAVSPEVYFEKDFMHLTCYAGRPEDAARIMASLRSCEGVRNFWTPAVVDCAAVLDRTGDLPAARMDLCHALLREGNISEAGRQLRLAADGGYSLPGLIRNARACIAAARGDTDSAARWLDSALTCHPHQVVVDNLMRLSAWQAAGNAGSGRPPDLRPPEGFETALLREHPAFPEPDPVVYTDVGEPVMEDLYF